MRLRRFISIKVKLIFIIVFISGISLFLVSTIILWAYFKTEKKQAVERLKVQSEMIAEYCIPALEFEQPELAKEILQSQKYDSSILNVALYDNEKELIYRYNKFNDDFKIPPIENEIFYTFETVALNLQLPVTFKENIIGYLFVRQSNDYYKKHAWSYVKTLIIIFIVAMFIIYFLALYFQKIITLPLLKLAQTAKKIKTKEDYSLRAEYQSNDEINLLYQEFNHMVAHIEKNEMELKIKNVDLEHAKLKAEESDRLKSAFLANMSHEIRTPMNSILGFSELLLSRHDDPKEMELFIQMINNSGEQLLRLIDDIIDFSKIESDQLKVEPTLMEVNKTMRVLVNSLKQNKKYILKPEVSMELVIPDEDVDYELFIDEIRFKQVLSNFISNAIKNTDEGIIEVGYSKQKSSDGDFLRFYVKDSGTGIPEDKLQLIFERFAQIENYRMMQGAGLGLSIAKGLVKIMNGKINVESELGKGSTFYVDFPLAVS